MKLCANVTEAYAVVANEWVWIIRNFVIPKLLHSKTVTTAAALRLAITDCRVYGQSHLYIADKRKSN